MCIDISIDMYSSGRRLPISIYKDIYQYQHFMYNYKLTLQLFKINPKCEEIVHFYLIYL